MKNLGSHKYLTFSISNIIDGGQMVSEHHLPLYGHEEARQYDPDTFKECFQANSKLYDDLIAESNYWGTGKDPPFLHFILC